MKALHQRGVSLNLPCQLASPCRVTLTKSPLALLLEPAALRISQTRTRTEDRDGAFLGAEFPLRVDGGRDGVERDGRRGAGVGECRRERTDFHSAGTTVLALPIVCVCVRVAVSVLPAATTEGHEAEAPRGLVRVACAGAPLTTWLAGRVSLVVEELVEDVGEEHTERCAEEGARTFGGVECAEGVEQVPTRKTKCNR